MKDPAQRRKSRYMAFFNVPLIPELTARRAGGRFDTSMARAGMTPEEVARFRREIVEYGALPHALGWYRALPLTRPGTTDFTVTVPTTLVWSTRDIAIDRVGVEGTERWVEAPYDLVVLDGVSHWIPTHAPRECADAIPAGARGCPGRRRRSRCRTRSSTTPATSTWSARATTACRSRRR